MLQLGEFFFYFTMYSALLRWNIYASYLGFEQDQPDQIASINYGEEGVAEKNRRQSLNANQQIYETCNMAEGSRGTRSIIPFGDKASASVPALRREAVNTQNGAQVIVLYARPGFFELKKR